MLPVGNAGNIAAYWKGYLEYAAHGHASRRPRMWGFQAEGAAPLVTGQVVRTPETVATAIRVGNPASWLLAEAARDESGGVIEAVTDLQILDAQGALAARDGVFVEPASAAGVAGLLQRHAAGQVEAGCRIVVTVTGHGLKDIDTALEHPGSARRRRGRQGPRPGCRSCRPGVGLMAGPTRRAAVRAPATSANLGPGFDALGLCLGLYDDLEATTTATGLLVEVSGTGADEVPTDESHLVVRSMRAALDVMDVPQPGLSARPPSTASRTAVGSDRPPPRSSPGSSSPPGSIPITP